MHFPSLYYYRNYIKAQAFCKAAIRPEMAAEHCSWHVSVTHMTQTSMKKYNNKICIYSFAFHIGLCKKKDNDMQ